MATSSQAAQVKAYLAARRAVLEKAEVVDDDDRERIKAADFFTLSSVLALLLDKDRSLEFGRALELACPKGTSKTTILQRLARSKRFGASRGQKLLTFLPAMNHDELIQLVGMAAAFAQTDIEEVDYTALTEQGEDDLFEDPSMAWEAGYVGLPDALEALGERILVLARELVERAYDVPALERGRAIRTVIDAAQWRECFRLVRWRPDPLPDEDQEGPSDPLDHDVRRKADDRRQSAANARTAALLNADVVSDPIDTMSQRDFFSLSRLLEAIYSNSKERLFEVARKLGIEPKRSNASIQSVALQVSRSSNAGTSAQQKLLALLDLMTPPELVVLIGLAATVSETALSELDWDFVPDGLPGDELLWSWSACYEADRVRLNTMGAGVRDLATALVTASYGERSEHRRAALRRVIESPKWRHCFRLVKWKWDSDEDEWEPTDSKNTAASDHTKRSSDGALVGTTAPSRATAPSSAPIGGVAPGSEQTLFGGTYVVLAKLPSGGMSEGYRVRGPDGRIYFLKKVSTQGLSADALRREQSIYGTLQRDPSPHILEIQAVERDAESLALVVEYAERGTLEDEVRNRKGNVSYVDARTILLEIIAGLRHLHQHQIVHRDLKPENVFRAGEHWKLGDFGISKSLKRLVTQGRTFQMTGTRGYASPEQFDGAEAHFSADVYALGKLMAYLLTGSTDVDLIPFPPWSGIARRCTERLPENRPELDEVERLLRKIVV